MYYSTRKKWKILFTISILQLLGIFFFAKGFFPYKANLSGLSTVNDLPPLPNGEKTLLKPKFDRLIFMLIDALRSDFVFGKNSGMKFVQSLISERHAIPYTAIATAPTVTLPRIKALTTGTVPNFLDAILNIAESDTSSSLANQDNWLIQLKNVGNKSISFFGDDTWIKLFPGLFHETDGTTSFFATDTIEVDLNVTRNIIPQLSKPEWDVLIFHYLGLDHVGHSSGPYSPLMVPKQYEMDEVVKIIYEIILEQDKKRIQEDPNVKPTLFVLCGDHGMNEAGNHGGSSTGETSTAFVFMSSIFDSMKHVPETFSAPLDEHSMSFYKVINQVDFVSTISYLFGIPIPKNNLGILLLDLLVDIDALEKLRALQLNAHQISGILQSLWSSFDRNPNVTNSQSELNCDLNADDDQARLQCLYSMAHYYHAKSLEVNEVNDINNSLLFYNKFISNSGSHLASSFSDYDITSMFVGLFFMILALCNYLIVMLDTYVQWNKQFGRQDGNRRGHLEFFSITGIILFCITLFASSYIEEEHQFWYYWIQTMWIVSIILSFRLKIRKLVVKQAFILVCQMVLVRLIRTWNQTGQKFAGEIDLKFYLNTSHNKLMWILYFGTSSALTIITLREIHKLYINNNPRRISLLSNILQIFTQLIVIMILVSVTKYKLEVDGGVELFPKLIELTSFIVRTTQVVTLARLIYVLLVISLFLCKLGIIIKNQSEKGLEIKNFQKIILCLITYLFILLSRPHNVPLYGLYYIQFYLFLYYNNNSLLTPLSYNFFIILFEFLSFFSLGNSNSLSSIDISHSYTGINDYNVVLVGLLTFLGNWSGPIWWCLASIILRKEIKWKLTKETNNNNNIKKVDDDDKIKQNVILFLDYYIYTSIFHSIVIFILSIGVMILRNHLFIWTVFSPKYLYQIIWNTLFHFGVELILIGIFEILSIYR
ncbi:alkaline-phosphatase-like protein [Glomus cerebriforme]|uniref:GPI ethanolamine phosphate transferase 2 n=1 Tax=Glomus cerebriforme TaxID=658196 RepID=A0A397TK61_9GLOM|nr:alkaline-phosphatase-like protein [Glomus cerebriforme]